MFLSIKYLKYIVALLYFQTNKKVVNRLMTFSKTTGKCDFLQ